MSSTDATARIEGDEIVIRVQVATRAHEAVVPSAFLDGHCSPTVRITDARLFADGFVRALNHEEENGETAIHRLLDEAFTRAVEDGSEGVDFSKKAKP